jgi:hypothetical protein
MAEPDELDEGLAADLREMAEALRRRRELLGDNERQVDVDNDLLEAIRLLDQAADKLMSEG